MNEDYSCLVRKAQDLTKTIIDQFLLFPTLVNYLRKLCISALPVKTSKPNFVTFFVYFGNSLLNRRYSYSPTALGRETSQHDCEA